MIEVDRLYKTYGKGKVLVPALKNVFLTIEQGEFVAIIGPSGSGKSTLLHILGFLDRPDKGTYKIFGTDISQLSDDGLAHLRNNLVGFVFQQFHLLRRTSALENVELPLIYAGKASIKEKAIGGLKSVGLLQRKKHLPNELSGGEQQRVAVARALVNDPMIIFADEPTGNLDTKSEEEIMRILTMLNKQGKTIIMVTHEKEVARHAKRIITIRDGDIVSDKKNGAEKVLSVSSVSAKEIVAQSHSYFARVEFAEHLRQSFRAIFANKVRSFLSMLGILFGVAAVIAMVALGEGAKQSMEEQLKTLGSNLLVVRGGSATHRGVMRAAGSITRFTLGDVGAIRELKPLIRKASGYVNGSGQVVYRSENRNTSINGVDSDYGEMRAAIPEVGRWFTEEDMMGREKVAVVGRTVANKLFANKSPIGETVKINRINFKIIGIAPEKGSAGPRDQDDVIYIPVTTAMYRLLGRDYLDGIYAEVKDGELMDKAQKEIEQLIIKRHRIHKNDDDSFHIRDMSEFKEMLSSTTKTMSLLLGCIAAISLLVGGIGIMNIMLVSVTERTGEIGLRKAVGARARDIMTQFLIEAIAMTLSGGFMGILLGVTVSVILSYMAGWATKVTISNIMLAAGFSVSIGIFFGLWPAHKAAQLNPIEALRYE